MLSSPMDDLLLEAIAEVAGTQIAFSNGWRYGAPVPAGPITLGDLWNMVPTNPPVSLTEVTGAEIRQMIEENLERTFAADPYDQMGRSEEHTSELQSLMRTSSAVFWLKKKKTQQLK